jgi:hypothetical protein
MRIRPAQVFICIEPTARKWEDVELDSFNAFCFKEDKGIISQIRMHATFGTIYFSLW